MEEIIESTVNAEPVENVDPQIDNIEQASTSNVSEEVVKPHVEEKPVQDAETNSMYAKVRREAEAKAKDEAIAEMGMEWNGKPITTYSAYKQALAEKAEYDRRAALEAQGIDPTIIDKHVNENPDVKWAREQREKQAQAEANWNDFVNVKNDFENIKNPEDIPREVFEYKEKTGKTLYDSMTWFENKTLKAKLAEYEKGSKVQQANASNAATSTGSLTGNGTATADFISFDTFEANKNDSKWVMKNFSKIQESRVKW